VGAARPGEITIGHGALSSLSHLDLLGHEAVHILRETAAQFARDAILFSGGKDSLVLAALARKAVAAGMIL
jgi:sulfate adenylyltransferase subunit 2